MIIMTYKINLFPLCLTLTSMYSPYFPQNFIDSFLILLGMGYKALISVSRRERLSRISLTMASIRSAVLWVPISGVMPTLHAFCTAGLRHYLKQINMEKEFCRVRSVKDIIIWSFLVSAGCALIAFPTPVSVNILGLLMVMTGMILGFILKTGYRDSESGEMYCKQERFFAKSCKPELEAAIAKTPCKLKPADENQGTGLRLDIYYNRKNGKAYAQLFEYVPYTYEPCSCIYEHDISKVDHLLSK